MEESLNMTDEGDMHQVSDSEQLGRTPGDGFGPSDHSVRLDNMLDEEGMRERDGLQSDETRRHMHNESSGQTMVQNVERTLGEMVEQSYLDDDEMDARMAAAVKELAEAEERRIRQHEGLVLIRKQLAEVSAQTKREEEKNKKLEAWINDIEVEFHQLDSQHDQMATSHAHYVEKRARVCKYYLVVEEIEELMRQELESLKEQGQRELADLDLRLEEEQTKTNALLNEQEDCENLEEENNEIDKEIRGLEIKLEVEMKRDQEEREQIMLLKDQIAVEEEKLKGIDEMEEEVNRLHQVNEEKRTLLNAALARKDLMKKEANIQKNLLEATSARYNSLKKESSALKKEFEKINSKRATIRKDLEQCIKDLVILPRINALEIDNMLKMKSDFEESIRKEETKQEKSQKENDARKERISALERELTELNLDTLQKQAKLHSLKTTFTQEENKLLSSVEALEMIKSKIEERKNEDAYAKFCYEDELTKVAVDIQHLSLVLKEIDDNIAIRGLEKNILEEEYWEVYNQTAAFRESITSVKPVDDWLEEMKSTFETQIRELTEASSKARQTRDALRSEIEELSVAAVKAQEADTESLIQEEKSAESATPHLKAKLLATLQMTDELKQKYEESKKSLSSLKETEAKLEKEIESSGAANARSRKSVLKQQIEEVEKQIVEKRRNVEALDAENTVLEEKMAEEKKRGEEALSAKQKGITALVQLVVAKEEESRQCVLKFQRWKERIEENKGRCAARLKRTKESEENLAVLEKEVSDLEEKLKQLQNDASEKGKQRKKHIETLEKEIVAIKKAADNKDKAFHMEKNVLFEKIKQAQKALKALIAERSKAEESKENPAFEARNQDGWSSIGIRGRPYSDTNTFGVPTQRTGTDTDIGIPSQQQERELSPSSESVSSVELSNEDMAAVRSGRVSIWSLVKQQSQDKKSRKKSASQQ